jgi:shikimate kinase
MKIFLIGLPGSGKSTLGRELATALNLSFVDLDMEIEKETGKRIKVIFEESGEDYFRHLESTHLKKWIGASANFVMATGGGTPCFFDHMMLMNQSGMSIFLDVPPDEIARRMGITQSLERPLLAQVSPGALEDKIDFMRSNRLPYYALAHITISGNEISTIEIMERISAGGVFRQSP